MARRAACLQCKTTVVGFPSRQISPEARAQHLATHFEALVKRLHRSEEDVHVSVSDNGQCVVGCKFYMLFYFFCNLPFKTLLTACYRINYVKHKAPPPFGNITARNAHEKQYCARVEIFFSCVWRKLEGRKVMYGIARAHALKP